MVAVLGERTAVHVQERRVAVTDLEPGRPHHPRLHLRPVGRGRGEALGRHQRRPRQRIVAEMGEPALVVAGEHEQL